MEYAVVDTESSGLFDWKKPADAPGQPRMAAMGIILIDEKFNVQSSHGFLIKPDGWVFDDDCEAAKVNGLTQSLLVSDGVSVREPLRIYGEAIDSRRIIVGFNILHDLKMLRAEARHVGFPDRYMQTRYICVMQGCRQIVDARTADGRKKAPRLEEACAHFGIEVAGAQHQALPDTERAYEILLRLRDAGCVPEFTDPYDKGKPKKPAARPQGQAYEEQVLAEQGDFLRGASEDGK